MISFLVILLGALFMVLLAATAVLAAVTGCRALARSWRDARAVIRQTEDERAAIDAHIASVLALTCQLCHDGGNGRCTCPAYCGHRGCTYDHTTLSLYSAEDAAYLRGLGISEGDHQ